MGFLARCPATRHEGRRVEALVTKEAGQWGKVPWHWRNCPSTEHIKTQQCLIFLLLWHQHLQQQQQYSELPQAQSIQCPTLSSTTSRIVASTHCGEAGSWFLHTEPRDHGKVCCIARHEGRSGEIDHHPGQQEGASKTTLPAYDPSVRF